MKRFTDSASVAFEMDAQPELPETPYIVVEVPGLRQLPKSTGCGPGVGDILGGPPALV